MPETDDLRAKGRRKTLFGGVIYDENKDKWDCKISDISESGAMVKSAAPLKAGSFVDLRINKYKDLRRVEVMWAKDGVIGLRFLVELKKSSQEMSRFFEIFDD